MERKLNLTPSLNPETTFSRIQHSKSGTLLVAALAGTLFGIGIALEATPAAWALSLPSQGIWAGVTGASTPKAALTEINRSPAFLQWKNSMGEQNDVEYRQSLQSSLLTTEKFQHRYQGIEVLGSSVLRHQGASRSEINSHLALFQLDPRPEFSASQAASLARSSQLSDTQLLRAPELKILPEANRLSARLIYWVSLRETGKHEGSNVLIDAHSGQILASMSHHQEIAPIDIYNASGLGKTIDPSKDYSDDEAKALSTECQLIHEKTGSPLLVNPSACLKVASRGRLRRSADESAQKALSNSRTVLEYFLNRHQRDSFDNRGTTAVSVVHVGVGYTNAFWDSEQDIMAYGDGDGVQLGSFVNALDVAGHEMTHGVTSKTSNLVYMGESGALNEGFSDFFGKMIEGSDDWSIGKALYIRPGMGEGFRDLADPAKIPLTYRDDNGARVRGKYPKHVSEALKTTRECGRQNDNCFVHINSTIPAHSTYQIAQRIGREKAEKLLYAVLTQGLTETSDFAAYARVTRSTCALLSPALSASDCTAVDQALSVVGL